MHACHTLTHTYTHTHMHVCTHTHACTHTHKHTRMRTFIHHHPDRQTDRQTHTHILTYTHMHTCMLAHTNRLEKDKNNKNSISHQHNIETTTTTTEHLCLQCLPQSAPYWRAVFSDVGRWGRPTLFLLSLLDDSVCPEQWRSLCDQCLHWKIRAMLCLL